MKDAVTEFGVAVADERLDDRSLYHNGCWWRRWMPSVPSMLGHGQVHNIPKMVPLTQNSSNRIFINIKPDEPT